ncbi:MAG: FAD-dependent oxidoreductase [Clostridia bacterium]|nr:FAD-dependent oxidoreductase [Clostridia bacterium]
MKKISVLLLAAVLVMTACVPALSEVYSGTAQGFGGDVNVSLTIENGTLTNVAVEGVSETEGVGSRAVDAMPGMMIEANSVVVDGVSGATITSNAILAAAKQALDASGAELASAEPQAASVMVPGTYTATAAGFHGPVTLDVEVTENTISSVTVVSENETAMVGKQALPILVSSTVNHQVIADAVSGATFTSNGYAAALEDALTQAGANQALLKQFRQNKAEITACEDTETDVVVVGAGTAGLVAAMKAHDDGARVILLEKTGITGGSASLSHGTIWALHMPETTADGMYDYDADDVYELFNKLAHPVSSKEVLYAIANNTTNGINYLRENGYAVEELDKSQAKFAPYINAMMHAGMGYGFTEMLDRNVHERGIDLRLNTAAVSLKTNENGQVCGVVAENGAGQYTISARKVILATGGYTHNDEMLAQYGGGHWQNNMKWSAIGGTGDGQRMGLEAGGQLVGEGVMHIHAVAGRQDSFFDYMPMFALQLVVDDNGMQMTACDEHYSTAALKMTTMNGGYGNFLFDANAAFATALLEQMVTEGYAVKADSLEKLAEKAGLPVDNLLMTVQQHNRHIATGTPDAWTSDPASMIPFNQAPYYCLRRQSVIMGTVAGLKINENMEVVKENGEPIGNLYATGELIFGNLFNNVYPMSGTAITTCISSGQLAAEHAAAALKE